MNSPKPDSQAKDNTNSAYLGHSDNNQIVDPNSIAKFHNPHHGNTDQTPNPHHPSTHPNNPSANNKPINHEGRLVAAKAANIPRKPEQKTHHAIHGIDQSRQHSDKKVDARIKLVKMRKQSHWHTLRFAIISFIVFLVIFNFQFIYGQLQFYINSRSTQKVANIDPIKPSSSSNQAEAVAGPNEIIIPKINVRAPLVFIDTTEEKAVLLALQDGVVHYAGTANPGENGNSVFFGHSSNDIWEKGNYKFVFALLEKLTVGDQYEIHYQSKKYIYTVEETKVVMPTDLTVLDQTPTPYSTLITCTPPGTSWKRFIVKAKQTTPSSSAQIAIPPATNTPQTKGSVLPSAPPSILQQLQTAVGNFFSNLLGNNNNSSPGTNDPNTPSNHLPEVSRKSTESMPTTF